MKKRSHLRGAAHLLAQCLEVRELLHGSLVAGLRSTKRSLVSMCCDGPLKRASYGHKTTLEQECLIHALIYAQSRALEWSAPGHR